MINACDEKGNKLVKDKIKMFINYNMNKTKIIIINEADSLNDET